MSAAVLPLLGLSGFFGLWGLITVLGLVEPLFLPTPWSTGIALYGFLFVDHSIYLPLWCSVQRMLLGFGIGVGLGVPFGVFLGSSKRIFASFSILVDFLRSIPSTSFFPLFMLIMGVGDAPKIAVVAMGCFFVCVINSAFGVLHCSPNHLLVAEVMGASRTFIFFRVRLPEAMPNISSAIRVSISYAVVLVVVSEMFVGTDVGLGRLIYDFHTSFRTAEMYATIFVAGGIGYFANLIYALIEKRVFHWSGKVA